MARKPRPIDPTEGPLQAFAHELRNVREQAGNPTYRALAVTAGFSASTLSDAAGGMRQPTLEVTLAYVGACGGDVALWEERWQELNAVLNDFPRQRSAEDEAPEAETESSDPQSAPPPPATGAATGAPSAPATADGRSADLDTLEADPDLADEALVRRRRRPTVGVLVAAAAAALALVAGLIATTQSGHGKTVADPSPSASAAPDCGVDASIAPADNAKTKFFATTYGAGAHVHPSASLNSSILRTVPAGCQLHFSGYCLGDVVNDSFGGAPDMRWFQLSTGGLVASAIVHGNPPKDLPASSCPGEAPLPSGVTLAFRATASDAGSVELEATGTHLALVGFAAYFTSPLASPPAGASASPTSTGPTWHHLDLVELKDSQFSSVWRVAPIRAAQPGTPITVVAVACLGGGGPTDVADARLLPADLPPTDPTAKPTLPQAATLPPAQLQAATVSACNYPGVNVPRT
ncbi:helix-turn-helix domain-containing protein [Kitasatospora sp. NPDC058965]|uniref:helix-turn-helix domain-containing protein n=1 Tax=Kitasatospora sp. NPDC058965 TaxID=3346682 RepID=UPI0036809DA6